MRVWVFGGRSLRYLSDDNGNIFFIDNLLCSRGSTGTLEINVHKIMWLAHLSISSSKVNDQLYLYEGFSSRDSTCKCLIKDIQIIFVQIQKFIYSCNCSSELYVKEKLSYLIFINKATTIFKMQLFHIFCEIVEREAKKTRDI